MTATYPLRSVPHRGTVGAHSRGGLVDNGDELLIQDFLDWLAAGNQSASTIRQRGYVLRAFAREHSILDATEKQVTDYLSRPTRGANGKRTVVSALRVFYNWLAAREYVTRTPLRLVHQVREEKSLPKPVPDEVFEAAMHECDDVGDLDGARMLMLGYYAGLRLSEIAAFHSRSITDIGLVIKGKGRVTRRVPVHPRLAPYLAGIDGYAFPSWRIPGRHVTESYIAERVCSMLGGGYTCHTLRHAFATRIYKATKDLRLTQQLMGHSSPTTTARYTLITNDEMEAAINSVA